MPRPDRGILYIVWGNRSDQAVDRSIQSVKKFHPDLPIEIVRKVLPEKTFGLIFKSQMGSLTPFRTTLYLDADTLVLGNLDYAFARADEYGLACSICECPWLRRYDQAEEDGIEYNTGVLFFSEKSAAVFTEWEKLAPNFPSRSRVLVDSPVPIESPYDDQASFSHAVRSTAFNPFILPLNFNFRPDFYPGFFLPLKIWHDYREIPPDLLRLNEACANGRQFVTYVKRTAPGNP